MASVMGREFQLAPLVQLSDLPAEGFLTALEEGLATGLIEEEPGNPERYQFSHALIQETLTAELSAARRVRLHARIAETQEALYGTEANNHAAELAHHFNQAEPVLGPEKLVSYSLLAGEQALAAYAWEEALTYFQRGLVAKGVDLASTEPAKDDDTAALLFGKARAQAGSEDGWQPGDFAASLCRAFDYYAEAGYAHQAVAIAEFPDYRLRYIPGLEELITRAMALVPPDSHEAGRLLCRHAQRLGVVGGDYDGA